MDFDEWTLTTTHSRALRKAYAELAQLTQTMQRIRATDYHHGHGPMNFVTITNALRPLQAREADLLRRIGRITDDE